MNNKVFNILNNLHIPEEDNYFSDSESKNAYDDEVKSGELYCMTNEVYVYYGEDVFKLGEAGNATERVKNYITSYITPCVILYKVPVRNSILAENILFLKLSEYRVVQNREFFKCNLEIIKKEMDNIANLFLNYSDEEIREQFNMTKSYKQIIKSKITNEQLNDIFNAKNINDKNFNELLKKQLENKLSYEEKCIIDKHLHCLNFKIKPKMLTIEILKQIYGKIQMVRKNNDILFYKNEINNDDKKCKIIINVIEFLGFKIMDNKISDISINKEEFIKNKNNTIKIFDNEFIKLFRLKNNYVNYIKKTLGKDEDSNKKFLGFLNGLLDEYGFTIDVVRKSKRIGGDVLKKSVYKLNFNDVIKVIK